MKINREQLAWCVSICMGLAILWIKSQNMIPMIQTSHDPYLTAYFNTFNETDAKIRHCDRTRCQSIYENHLRPPTQKELEHLERLTIQVDALSARLATIPWKFRIFWGDIESHFPHTHGDFIYIHEDHVSTIPITTLLHEKIHVFQRMFPCETHDLIVNYWGFSFHSMRYGSAHDIMRANPDVNRIIYADDQGKTIMGVYKKNAQSLNDIEDSRDHPYEMMAYALSDPGLFKYPYTNTRVHISKEQYHALLAWAKKYLIIL